jgi:hypothetical protein
VIGATNLIRPHWDEKPEERRVSRSGAAVAQIVATATVSSRWRIQRCAIKGRASCEISHLVNQCPRPFGQCLGMRGRDNATPPDV